MNVPLLFAEQSILRRSGLASQNASGAKPKKKEQKQTKKKKTFFVWFDKFEWDDPGKDGISLATFKFSTQ
jgi:hypothetical protein